MSDTYRKLTTVRPSHPHPRPHPPTHSRSTHSHGHAAGKPAFERAFSDSPLYDNAGITNLAIATEAARGAENMARALGAVMARSGLRFGFGREDEDVVDVVVDVDGRS